MLRISETFCGQPQGVRHPMNTLTAVARLSIPGLLPLAACAAAAGTPTCPMQQPLAARGWFCVEQTAPSCLHLQERWHHKAHIIPAMRTDGRASRTKRSPLQHAGPKYPQTAGG